MKQGCLLLRLMPRINKNRDKPSSSWSLHRGLTVGRSTIDLVGRSKDLDDLFGTRFAVDVSGSVYRNRQRVASIGSGKLLNPRMTDVPSLSQNGSPKVLSCEAPAVHFQFSSAAFLQVDFSGEKIDTLGASESFQCIVG